MINVQCIVDSTCTVYKRYSVTFYRLVYILCAMYTSAWTLALSKCRSLVSNQGSTDTTISRACRNTVCRGRARDCVPERCFSSRRYCCCCRSFCSEHLITSQQLVQSKVDRNSFISMCCCFHVMADVRYDVRVYTQYDGPMFDIEFCGVRTLWFRTLGFTKKCRHYNIYISGGMTIFDFHINIEICFS